MLKACGIDVAYDSKVIIEDLSLEIRKGEIVSIIGPNGSGKSTLLKSLCRLLKVKSGHIELEDKSMVSMNGKEVAKILAMLSQHNTSPKDISVRELVYYGRVPHKKWYEPRNKEDEEIVLWALENTGTLEYENRTISQLSGGERQRVWLAVALAQRPRVLLLDEPTTYMDMCHQLELMELVKDINKKFGMTILMVLHDLNQAARYSHRVVIMKKGKIIANGRPEDVINCDIINDVYNVKCCISKDPINNKPQIYPIEVCYREKERCCKCAI